MLSTTFLAIVALVLGSNHIADVLDLVPETTLEDVRTLRHVDVQQLTRGQAVGQPQCDQSAGGCTRKHIDLVSPIGYCGIEVITPTYRCHSTSFAIARPFRPR